MASSQYGTESLGLMHEHQGNSFIVSRSENRSKTIKLAVSFLAATAVCSYAIAELKGYNNVATTVSTEQVAPTNMWWFEEKSKEVSSVLEKVGTDMKTHSDHLQESLKNSTSTIAEDIKNATKSTYDKVKESTGDALEKAKESSENIGEKIKESTSSIGDKIKNATSGVDEDVKKAEEGAEKAGEKAKETAGDIGEKIKETSSDIFDKIKNSTSHIHLPKLFGGNGTACTADETATFAPLYQDCFYSIYPEQPSLTYLYGQVSENAEPFCAKSSCTELFTKASDYSCEFKAWPKDDAFLVSKLHAFDTVCANLAANGN